MAWRAFSTRGELVLDFRRYRPGQGDEEVPWCLGGDEDGSWALRYSGTKGSVHAQLGQLVGPIALLNRAKSLENLVPPGFEQITAEKEKLLIELENKLQQLGWQEWSISHDLSSSFHTDPRHFGDRFSRLSQGGKVFGAIKEVCHALEAHVKKPLVHPQPKGCTIFENIEGILPKAQKEYRYVKCAAMIVDKEKPSHC